MRGVTELTFLFWITQKYMLVTEAVLLPGRSAIRNAENLRLEKSLKEPLMCFCRASAGLSPGSVPIL